MWHRILIRYLLFVTGANLVWEVAHLPLYTIWTTGSLGELTSAVVHCTGGDVMIALASLTLALIVSGRKTWPAETYVRVAAVATMIGLGYTIYSEWLNTEIRQSWAYAEAMPRLPLLGTGLSSVAQWIFLPPLGFWWARRRPLHTRD